MVRAACIAPLLGAGFVLTATLGWAQTPLPGPAQPPQLQERFRPQPMPPEGGGVPMPAAPRIMEVPPDAPRFRLADIAIAGVTVYQPEVLRGLYAELIGTEVSLAQIAELAGRLTARYRADGYILSQVVVPEQQVEGGVVRLQAVEGFVDRVIPEGEIAGSRRLIDAFAARIRNARPLTAAELERNLLLIGDLPGVNVQGVLEPSPTAFGAADLRVIVSHRPAEGFAMVDNRGSRFVGPWNITVGGSAYSPLGLYEQFDLLAAFTPDSDEFGYIQGQFSFPIGPADSGDVLQLFGAGGRVRPNIPSNLFPFDSEARSFEGRATYFHPFLRSRASNLSGRASFIWRDVSTRISDLPADINNPTDDRVRALQLRGTYDFTDRIGGVSLIDLQLNRGIDVFGASNSGENTSRQTSAGASFTYANATISRNQRLAEQWSLYFEANGQYSWDPLLPTERMGVGGQRFGRGYPPGNITGDHGIAGKLELRYGGLAGWAMLDSYQVYGFLDGGRTWDVEGPGAVRGDLVSGGLGARLNLTERVSFNPELTHQLIGNPADRPGRHHETRFLFSLVTRF
jgi:hemolysin activation/secretion protein